MFHGRYNNTVCTLISCLLYGSKVTRKNIVYCNITFENKTDFFNIIRSTTRIGENFNCINLGITWKNCISMDSKIKGKETADFITRCRKYKINHDNVIFQSIRIYDLFYTYICVKRTAEALGNRHGKLNIWNCNCCFISKLLLFYFFLPFYTCCSDYIWISFLMILQIAK